MQNNPNCRVLMMLENAVYDRDARVPKEVNTLVAAGYHVSVICPAAKGEPWHEIREGLDLYRFPSPPSGNGALSYLWEYSYSMVAMFVIGLYILFKVGFDVIHSHHPPDTTAFSVILFKLLGKSYVVDHHDLAPELYYARFGGTGNRFLYRILVALENFACRLADQIITTNESYKSVLKERAGVPDSRITVVRNGPDLNELPGVDQYVSDPNDGRIVLGYMGVIAPQDGVDYLLRALYHLRHDLNRTDFKCIVLGNGSALEGMKSLSAELQLDDGVTFTGWIDERVEISRYLMSMDICIAPEPSDAYNDRTTVVKLMEYMAAGKPAVAFDLPEHRVTAQAAAVYARPNDELDMARQIALLMDDPERREQMGRLGRKRIETELAWQYQADALLRAYELLVLKSRPAEPKRVDT